MTKGNWIEKPEIWFSNENNKDEIIINNIFLNNEETTFVFLLLLPKQLQFTFLFLKYENNKTAEKIISKKQEYNSQKPR